MKSAFKTLAGAAWLSVAIAFFSLGMFKLWDLDSFRESLSDWKLIPTQTKYVLVWAIPLFEVSPMLLQLSARTRVFAPCVLLTFCAGALTAIYLHSAANLAPTCACFGVVQEYLKDLARTEVRVAILCFAAIASIVRLITLSARSNRAATHVQPIAMLNRPASARPGFTLIELIVSIAIVGVLIGIIVPSIAGFRAAAKGTKCLSIMREHTKNLTQYTSVYNDQFPQLIEAPSGTYTRANGITHFIGRYFDHCTAWDWALRDEYYPNKTPNDGLFTDPRSTEATGGTPLFMSCSIFAQPEYWDQRTRLYSGQFRSVKQSQVRYPSIKALMVSDHELRLNIKRPRAALAFIDGSAAHIRSDRVLPGVGTGDGPHQFGIHGMDWIPAMHTLNGSHGFDVRTRD